MGASRAKLFTRCCYAAVSITALAVMFWVAWCLFGLSVLPASEPQRRGLVHYPPSSTPSTSLSDETSASNAISKLPTTSSLAKGDFRPREKHENATDFSRGDSKPPRNISTTPKGSDPKLSGSQLEEAQTRRVSSSGIENRPKVVESSTVIRQPDIMPSKANGETHVHATRDNSEVPKRDDIQSSRPTDVGHREPEFDKGETLSTADRRRYGDDDRGSKGKYHTINRGRETDDLYSKGDTRVYPDDARVLPKDDDLERRDDEKTYRETSKKRHPEDRERKGDDDDSYRYPDERPRPYDLDRDREDRLPLKGDRYRLKNSDGDRDRDDDRYSSVRYDYRQRDRDDDKYHRDRDDDKYHRDRDDDLYTKDRDDGRIRGRDDVRIRDREDARIRDRDDGRITDRDDGRIRDRDDGRIRGRDDVKIRDRDDVRIRDRDDVRIRDRDDGRIRGRDDGRIRDRDDGRVRGDDDDRYTRDRDDGRIRGDDDRYTRDRGDGRIRESIDVRTKDPDDIRIRYRDDDRIKDRDDYRSSGRDDDRIRVRDDVRISDRDDVRIRDRDDVRIRDRDDDRIRDRDDDRIRDRDDVRIRDRDDDRIRGRDDDRIRDRDDVRIRDRDGVRIRDRDDDRYIPKDYKRPHEDERDSLRRVSDDKGAYRSRTDDDISVPIITGGKETPSRISSDLPIGDRKPASSRYEYDLRSHETVTDYDIPVRESSRSREEIPRSSYDDERNRERTREDDDRRPYRYEKDRLEISPTRTRGESLYSRSSIESRSKGSSDEWKNSDTPKTRTRDDGEGRRRDTVIQVSRSSLSGEETSRRYIDDRDRSRTRPIIESTRDYRSDSRDDIIDRKSYVSGEESRTSSRRDDDDRDRRRTGDDSERYRPSRRDDDLYDSRIPSDYDRGEERRRYRDDDRRYSRDPEPRPIRRNQDEDKIPRRDTVRIESSLYLEENPRLSSTMRHDDRSYARDEYDGSSSRYYDEDSRGSERTRRPTITKAPTTVISREPEDEVMREKRYPSPQNSEDGTREQSRPLSVKDVIAAVNRQSDTSDSNNREVVYPVFDPRLSNLTSPEVIQKKYWRGTTTTSKKKRSIR